MTQLAKVALRLQRALDDLHSAVQECGTLHEQVTGMQRLHIEGIAGLAARGMVEIREARDLAVDIAEQERD